MPSISKSGSPARWVFIRPRNRSPYYDPEIQEPLGLEYLAAHRRSVGDSVLILDAALDGLEDERLAKRAVAFRPDAVGFSVMTVQELESVRAIHAQALKSLNGREIAWIAGGNFVSTESPSALRLLPPGITLARFEGERALGDFSADLAGAGPRPKEISGSPVRRLEDLPFPERPYADMILGNDWAFNIQGSRGCCGNCAYCSSPGMAKDGKNGWRGRPAWHVAEEISHLNRRYGAFSFNFVDEDFLGPPRLALERARDFADELRRRRLKISFGIQVRPHAITEEICDILADAGLVYVFMGIESDSAGDCRRWGRPWVLDPWRFVERLKSRGVGVNAGVLLFHPHSTLEGVRRFADSLYSCGLLEHRAATNRLDAMPGSRMHRAGVKDGLIPEDVPGPQPLPFVFPIVESLHRDVLDAVNPLGPTCMHTLCRLPPALARRFANRGPADEVARLETIVRFHSEAVYLSLGALLDEYESTGARSRRLVSDLRRRNLDLAFQAARKLFEQGFATSEEALRHAISLDGGP